jgi:hypothetical protein
MTTVVTARTRFLHVPKTGGTWVVKALTQAGVPVVPPEVDNNRPQVRAGHATLADLEEYSDLFTIAFVRHPLSWWRSYWGYRMRRGWDDGQGDKIIQLARSDNFDDFIELVIENLPGHLNRLYSRYVGPPEQPISFVGRYESLTDDLVEGLRLGGEEFDEEKLRSCKPVNRSPYDRFPAEYTPTLREALLAAEHEVIERFYPDSAAS